MTAARFNTGAYVLGAPTSPRALARHADLFAAYAEGAIDDEREAYLSHFAFGPDFQAHYAANQNSVAGFAGPCWCRWLVLDIDRPDLADALADACKLAAFIAERHGADPAIYFSGSKGFHAILELTHDPPPAVGFQRTARTFCEALAARAGVRIDTSIYDIAHIVRLPNTRHPRTGLVKRRIDLDDLFSLDVPRVLERAKHPAGDGIHAARSRSATLAADWRDAEAATARANEARAAIRRDRGAAPDARAPHYFMDFLRFGVDAGERHSRVFRCAAWLTEQGAPPSLCHALLTEPACDVGLSPKDVGRQIACGIEHASRQRGTAADPMPDPTADPDACERWCIQNEGAPLPPGAMDWPFAVSPDGRWYATNTEGGTT